MTTLATLSERGQQYKVKHTRYSGAKITAAREALAVVHTLSDDFAREVQALTQIEVSPVQWERFLNLHVPSLDQKTGQPLTGGAKTLAVNEREVLERLYRHDERVSPWAGTGLGVLQAVNTYERHEGTIRGTTRPERNLLRTVTGDFARNDRQVLEDLQLVLAA